MRSNSFDIDAFIEYAEKWIDDLDDGVYIRSVNDKEYLIYRLHNPKGIYTLEMVQVTDDIVNISIDGIVYQLTNQSLYDNRQYFLCWLKDFDICRVIGRWSYDLGSWRWVHNSTPDFKE